MVAPHLSDRLRAKPIIGWLELVDLPDLDLSGVIAKIDTGARTSSLHVDRIELLPDAGNGSWAIISRRDAGPKKTAKLRSWKLPVKAFKEVKSSNGQTEHRAIIHTRLVLGGRKQVVDISLTDRSSMRYEMLVGRTALKGKFLIYPTRTFIQGGKSTAGPRGRKT